MKEERMMVLKMIQDGTITADEAAKLLETLGEKSKGIDSKEFEKNVEDKFAKTTESIESFAKDIGNKLEEAYKSIEPKVKKISKSVIEKTAGVVENASKALNEKLHDPKDECCCNKGEHDCTDIDIDKQIENIDYDLDNLKNSLEEDILEKKPEDN